MNNILYFGGNDILDCGNEDDRVVYHYTSPDSFLSIINSNKLWFSDIQFMNDRSEHVYIAEIFKQAAIETVFENKHDFTGAILGTPFRGNTITSVFNNRLRLSQTRYYLLCASQNPDSHNLWSYYVKNNSYQGYNIGICVKAFVESLVDKIDTRCKMIYGVVNYDRESQVRQLNSLLDSIALKYNITENSSNDDCLQLCFDELHKNIYNFRLFWKNPAFAHEEEYRFVIETPVVNYNYSKSLYIATGNSTAFSDIKLFPMNFHTNCTGLIVPHSEVSFEPRKIISSITIAPMMEREVAQLGVHTLLTNRDDNEINKIPINFSQIDVRY